MFTWRVLLDMGIRQRVYWLKQADALRRKRIAEIVYGVGIAMSEDSGKAVEELELDDTKEHTMEKRSAATWDMLKFIGGYKGV